MGFVLALLPIIEALLIKKKIQLKWMTEYCEIIYIYIYKSQNTYVC